MVGQCGLLWALCCACVGGEGLQVKGTIAVQKTVWMHECEGWGDLRAGEGITSYDTTIAKTAFEECDWLILQTRTDSFTDTPRMAV